jgi:hypothetical protein
MGKSPEIRGAQQRGGGRQGFPGKHIQQRARQAVPAERVNQGLDIKRVAPADIAESGVRR